MAYFSKIYSSDLPHRAKAVYMYLKDRSNTDGQSEERNAADYNFQELKKDFNSCQSENQRLKAENEQLLQKCSILQKEVDTLKKRLDRKEIALLKKL